MPNRRHPQLPDARLITELRDATDRATRADDQAFYASVSAREAYERIGTAQLALRARLEQLPAGTRLEHPHGEGTDAYWLEDGALLHEFTPAPWDAETAAMLAELSIGLSDEHNQILSLVRHLRAYRDRGAELNQDLEDTRYKLAEAAHELAVRTAERDSLRHELATLQTIADPRPSFLSLEHDDVSSEATP